MEHGWVKLVHPLLTLFGFTGLLPLCRSGETKVATEPELLDRPASAKAEEGASGKAPARKRRGATVASLKAKVERAQHEGNDGPSLGAMTYAERDKVLFGL